MRYGNLPEIHIYPSLTCDAESIDLNGYKLYVDGKRIYKRYI